MEGAYYLSNWAPDSSDASIRFIEKYKAKFGTEPDSWAALGYSAAMVVADALKRSGPNPDRARVRDTMRMTRDVPVLVGHGRVTFKPDRTPYYGMNVMMIRNGRAVLVP